MSSSDDDELSSSSDSSEMVRRWRQEDEGVDEHHQQTEAEAIQLEERAFEKRQEDVFRGMHDDEEEEEDEEDAPVIEDSEVLDDDEELPPETISGRSRKKLKNLEAERRDAIGAFARGHLGAKTPTNTTGVRGLDYKNSVDELESELTSDPEALTEEERLQLAPFLRNLARRLVEVRGDTVHFYRLRVVLTLRCFLEVLKLLLRYDETARAMWFQNKAVRVQLTTGFASYMASNGSMRLDMTAYPEAMWCVFWGALSYVSSTFNEAVAGWRNVSGDHAALSIPAHFNAEWRSANIEAIVENDELVTEKQGPKMVRALLAQVTSEHDFNGDAAREFQHHHADCKKMVAFLVAKHVALFPGDDDEEEDDGDDSEDVLLQKQVEAAFDFDKELAADPSFAPREDNEAKVRGDAKLKLDENEQEQIASFTVIAQRVVTGFADAVKQQFPRVTETLPARGRAPAREKVIDEQIVLPASNRTNRRKVVFVAHSFFDPYLVSSRRQFGINVSLRPSNFYFSDFAHVHDNVYIGDAGGAFHAGPAGFTLVINCASQEVPNYYETYPSRPVEYVSLALTGGPSGIAAMAKQDWQNVHAAVNRHLAGVEGGKILVHCVEGRHRSAGVVYNVLQQCHYLPAQAAFEAVFRVCPHMDFTGVPDAMFKVAFSTVHAPSLTDISFDHTIERLRIRYGGDGVLPVTTLTPFYTFTSGGAKCSLVDFLIQFGVKRFGFPEAVDSFARHIVRALENVHGRIHLVAYPSHSRGAESKLTPIIRAMCAGDSARFVDATGVLVRVHDSPQRSKGGDRSINLQFNTIACKLPDGAGENSTFVCLDDVLNTGSSFAVFAELMTRAGASGDNLRGIALGRFTHDPGHETESPFVIPSASVAADVSVAAPPDLCIDVPQNFDPPPALRCAVVCQRASHKTLSFPTSRDAAAAARSWIALGMDCCPHFPIDGVGFPVQLVQKAVNVARIVRVGGKSLFVLSKVGDAQGRARNARTQRAHQQWNALDDNARVQWEERSAAPVSSQDARATLQDVYPPVNGPHGDLGWDVLPYGGGNLVRFSNKKALNAALKDKSFGKTGFRLERAFGAVLSRVWVAASLSHDDALERIQGLSESHVICTLKGSSLTAKTLSKHGGGVLSVIGEKLRVESCPLIKWGCDATWTSTMQFCNEKFLGLVSWEVLKELLQCGKHEEHVVQGALERYFERLGAHCGATYFNNLTAENAARLILDVMRGAEHAIPLKETAMPLLALFHFSRKDIYRCMTYRDKLRGLSTAGGTLVHLGLHVPDLPWTGKSEEQKTNVKFREMSSVSRESAPFPPAQAEARVDALRSMLIRLPLIDDDSVLINAARAAGIQTKSAAEEKLKAAKNLLNAWRQRLIVLGGVVRELPSFVNAAEHLSVLVGDLMRALERCREALSQLTKVRFPATVLDESSVHGKNGKSKQVFTAGLVADLKNEGNKVKKLLAATLESCIQQSSGRVAEEFSESGLVSGSMGLSAAMEAARSARERVITLVFANDSGADGDFVTAIPEALAFYLYEVCGERNLQSRDACIVNEADPWAAELFDYFRLNEHTLRFELTSGFAKEARNTEKEQAKMAAHVAHQNKKITSLCGSALAPDIPFLFSGRAPLTAAGKRVAESLLESESIMSAPCKFLGSSSTLRALERVESILLRSIPLCNAYNVPLYRDARGQTRRAVDKIAQMQTNHIELVTLMYAHDPIVQLMHRVSHGEDVYVLDELELLRLGPNYSLLDINVVASQLPEDEASHLPFLIMKSCEVLRALQGSIVNYSKQRAHDEIAALRASWSRTGKDPPSAILCQGMWNRRAPGRGSFGTAWQRAKHQRATNRNLIRRAKQIRWHLKKKRLGQESTVTANFLSSVSIQSKRVSEIRSTKQKLSFAALLSHERIDTRGPPQSLFPGLSKDRPWKLRWTKGDDHVVHRDHMASCALAILGMWERYAFAHNQVQEQIDASRCVLLRPAVYLYHTDYAKWTNGTLDINKTQRW